MPEVLQAFIEAGGDVNVQNEVIGRGLLIFQ